ncbi:helix-turn-helix domain-containing protein [Microbacterium sp. CH12i]|uniref:helix-turn-helix domain-containing protein n=1 Tax=Microbacterium sp. CH12i TaxID=1479651 RepID=UPI002E164B34
MPEVPDVRFLTVAEVAEIMRVSKMTVYRLVHSGDLPAIRFGRSYRVPESAVATHSSSRSPTWADPIQCGCTGALRTGCGLLD